MSYSAPPVIVTLHGYPRKHVQTQATVTNDVGMLPTALLHFVQPRPPLFPRRAASVTDSSTNFAYAYGVAGLVAPYLGIAIILFLGMHAPFRLLARFAPL